MRGDLTGLQSGVDGSHHGFAPVDLDIRSPRLLQQVTVEVGLPGGVLAK